MQIEKQTNKFRQYDPCFSTCLVSHWEPEEAQVPSSRPRSAEEMVRGRPRRAKAWLNPGSPLSRHPVHGGYTRSNPFLPPADSSRIVGVQAGQSPRTPRGTVPSWVRRAGPGPGRVGIKGGLQGVDVPGQHESGPFFVPLPSSSVADAPLRLLVVLRWPWVEWPSVEWVCRRHDSWLTRTLALEKSGGRTRTKDNRPSSRADPLTRLREGVLPNQPGLLLLLVPP